MQSRSIRARGLKPNLEIISQKALGRALREYTETQNLFFAHQLFLLIFFLQFL